MATVALFLLAGHGPVPLAQAHDGFPAVPSPSVPAVWKSGGGGGNNDAHAICDTLSTSCAAAAAVALSGCVEATLEAKGSADGSFLIVFPLEADAEANVTIKVCESIASAQAFTSAQWIPATMQNLVAAGKSIGSQWDPIDLNENDRECVNPPLYRTLACGPTGATWWKAGVICVEGRGSALVNANDPLGGGIVPVGAMVFVQVKSAACSNGSDFTESDLAGLFESPKIETRLDDSPMQSSPRVVPFSMLDSSVQSFVRSSLAVELLGNFDAATAGWPTEDATLIDGLRGVLRQEIAAGANAFNGDVFLTQALNEGR